MPARHAEVTVIAVHSGKRFLPLPYFEGMERSQRTAVCSTQKLMCNNCSSYVSWLFPGTISFCENGGQGLKPNLQVHCYQDMAPGNHGMHDTYAI